MVWGSVGREGRLGSVLVGGTPLGFVDHFEFQKKDSVEPLQHHPGVELTGCCVEMAVSGGFK